MGDARERSSCWDKDASVGTVGAANTNVAWNSKKAFRYVVSFIVGSSSAEREHDGSLLVPSFYSASQLSRRGVQTRLGWLESSIRAASVL